MILVSSANPALDTNWAKIPLATTGHAKMVVRTPSTNANDVWLAIVPKGSDPPTGGEERVTYSLPPDSSGFDLEDQGGYENDVYARMKAGAGSIHAEGWA